jgi:hypothetical protein
MWVASVFAGRRNELNVESGILHRDGDMAAHEESHETKQGQDEDRHEPRFLVSPALKVKSLPTDRLLASHNPPPLVPRCSSGQYRRTQGLLADLPLQIRDPASRLALLSIT